MNFKQFLKEQESQELSDYLIEHCKPFFSKSDENPLLLLRGVSRLPANKFPIMLSIDGNERECIEAQVRKDRQPLTTGAEDHEIMDKWFEENFNHKFRSKALFCVGSDTPFSDINGYGHIALAIFPIGDFKFVWSPKIQDAYNDFTFFEKSSEERFRNTLDNAEYTDKDFERAKASEHEIMILADKYLAIPLTGTQDGKDLREYVVKSIKGKL